MKHRKDISKAISTERNKYRFKLQDIDIFNLHFPNSKDLRTVVDSSCLVYINVNSFIERIKTFIKI